MRKAAISKFNVLEGLNRELYNITITCRFKYMSFWGKVMNIEILLEKWFSKRCH